MVVANPLPADEQLDPELHDRVLAEALRRRGGAGVSGKDVTPFLLDGSTARPEARAWRRTCGS